MNQVLKSVVFCAASLAACLAHAQSESPSQSQAPIDLACHGYTVRGNPGNMSKAEPSVLRVRIDFAARKAKVRINGLNCWAGRGDCSLLAVSFSANTITLQGNGALSATGLSTVLEIDRRSGYLDFFQSEDPSGPSKPPRDMADRPETGTYVCQGGSTPRF